jgi:peptide deformylase
MIRSIVTDKKRLALVSSVVDLTTTQSSAVIADLWDTANYHRLHGKEGCAGLAANQIGYLDRIIAIWRTGAFVVMINPEIEILKGKWGQSHERCLSRPGVNAKLKRAKRIKVSYLDMEGDPAVLKLTGFDARVAQHEVDHLDGKFI